MHGFNPNLWLILANPLHTERRKTKGGREIVLADRMRAGCSKKFQLQQKKCY
jgi:hypothetical protein